MTAGRMTAGRITAGRITAGRMTPASDVHLAFVLDALDPTGVSRPQSQPGRRVRPGDARDRAAGTSDQ